MTKAIRTAVMLTVVLSLAGCQMQPKGVPIPDGGPAVEGGSLDSHHDPEIVDLGPRDGAMGAIELNANGTPHRYTVVAGDYPDAICYRFNLASEQLVFDDTGESVGVRINPSDVIRFVPYTAEKGQFDGRY